ncbi:MAG: bacillithiol biosynthesis BshC, partial [Planctomycetota bacterium]
LYKALHTIALARALEAAWRAPVVPLFWVHSDDHDLAEVNHAHVLNRNLDLARVGLPGMGSGRRPIAHLPLDQSAHRLPELRAHLLQLMPAEHGREAWLDAWFPRAGETLGQAFVRGWSAVLGAHGLLLLEPDTIRVPTSRALATLLASEPQEAFERGLSDARAAGSTTDLDPTRVPWAFVLRDGQRTALRAVPGGFQLDGEPGQRTAAEAAAEIVQDPGAWSTSVVTRPLVQDACLPVTAYIGGYGELEYHTPLAHLRAALDWRAPAFVPRLSGTLSSPAARAALERLGLTPEAFLEGGGQLPKPTAESSPVAGQIRSIGSKCAELAAQLTPQAQEIDRSLGPQLKRAAREASALFEKLARKAERVDANRRGKSRRHLRRLQNTWFGLDRPQERTLTAMQYLVAFGSEWIDSLLGELDPLGIEHVLIELSTGPTDP